MSYLGMDPDEVSALGGRLHNEASNLQSIMQHLDTLSNSMYSNWQGADSERFLHDYQGQYRPQVQQAIQQLSHLGDVAIHNANEQRQTSA